MDESKKILVVEDDDHVRLLLIEYLEEHAHLSVEGARDGAEALHHVATGQYALVILDLMMPFMTGIDFLDSLEAMISDPSIKPIASRPPVIVITSASPEQVPSGDLEQRFPLMVRDVLRKPVEPEKLAARVRELVSRS